MLSMTATRMGSTPIFRAFFMKYLVAASQFEKKQDTGAWEPDGSWQQIWLND